MGYTYATKTQGEKSSRARGASVAISMKQTVEICSMIRNKSVSEAKKMLQDVVAEKKAVPFTRFNKDVGHKPGMGAGRYPKKASGEILKIIQNAEANAQFKGLNTGKLAITNIMAQQASQPMHAGRKRRRKMKRTHVEVVLEEQK